MGLLSHSKDSSSSNPTRTAEATTVGTGPGTNTNTGAGTNYGDQYDATTGRQQGSNAFQDDNRQDVDSALKGDNTRQHRAQAGDITSASGNLSSSGQAYQDQNQNQNQNQDQFATAGAGRGTETGARNWTAAELEQQKRTKEAELGRLHKQHGAVVEAERLEQEAQAKRKEADNLAQGNFSSSQTRH